MNESYELLIADYLAGNLDEDGKTKVEQLIAEGKIDLIDFKAMEQLHEELTTVSTPAPSEAMSVNFYSMLESEKEAQASYKWVEKVNEWIASLTVSKLAYACVLLIAGGFIGSFVSQDDSQLEALSSQVQNMQEMLVVSMLEGASTTDRLKAVNISTTLPTADDKAIRALLFTLQNDESVNVRVQAIEALKRWGDHEDVREGLVGAIGVQESDIVIISLADAMIELELNSSKTEFEKLMNERELNIGVKEKIENTIAVL
ncbi:hypothetical protein [Balneola vulgaris]|uniref:hypothetical protein n=1 Tax=Balneola vulgaris TaxID=287535 RepID=UPI000363E02E|nr:hypothetical protein [Balneola vulgaris]